MALIICAWVGAEELPSANEAQVTLGYPVRRASGPIRVDGRLDDTAWKGAIKVAGFTISGSQELAAEQTVMKLLYDDSNLYLGVKCAESRMDSVVATVNVHDGSVWHDDCVEFFIDANHDHMTYWQFIVNAAGVRYDAYKFDRTWTKPWQAVTSRTDSAWYVEVAVPFASLGVDVPGLWDVWGFNLDRERRAGGKTQLYNWADVRGVFHSPALFGQLIFAGEEWPPSDAIITRIARAIEGDEARIYRDGGCWIVEQGKAPRSWSYRDLLRRQQGDVERYWKELDAMYQKRPQLVGRKDFEAYRERYEAARTLADAEGEVDPEACAAAKVFLDTLEDKLSELYWTAKVELLNETF
jgi:hypothetical protein